MCNSVLLRLIERFRLNDMEAFPLIYNEFQMLIHFYSGNIGEEDASQELTVFLLELLYELDISKFKPDTSQGLKRYIAVSLRNKYIAISKEKQKNEILLLQLYDDDIFYSDGGENNIFVKEILAKLSHKQRLIIIYKYIYNYSDAEISVLLNISRQAVNRLKNRGIENLRKFYLQG